MAGVSINFDIFGRDRTASKALRSVGNEADQTHRKFGKFGSGGKTAALALAGGVGIAAASFAAALPVIRDVVTAAADDEKSQRKLALGLKNTTGARDSDIASVEAWITKQGEALGVTDDALRPALQRLAQSTKDLGKAQSLTTLAMDVSAGSGKSLETVANALGRAYDGNTGALGRLGIKTKDAQGKALTFEQITKNMSATFGGQAAEAADTFGGKMGRLGLVFSEAKEGLGAKLMPTLDRFGGWLLDKGIPAARDLARQVGEKLRPTFDSLRKTFEDNRPALEKFGQMILAVGKWILTEAVPAFIKLEALVWKGLIVAFAALGKILPPIVAGFLRGAAEIVKGFSGLYESVTGVLSGILTVAERTMGWLPEIGDKIKAAKAGFANFRTDTIDKLRKVEGGLRSASDKVVEFGRKAKSIPEAKLKANIEDLRSKIATAKAKLQDPSLTKDRRAKLKADIAQLREQVNAAKRKLAEVRDKTVTIRARLAGDPRAHKYLPDAFASGGRVFGAGTPTSDSIAARLSRDEFVMRAAAARAIGYDSLDVMNATGRVPTRYVGLAAGGGSNSVTINVTIQGVADKRGAAEEVRSMLLDLKRTRGYALGLS